MRNASRKETLNLILEAWNMSPSLRLCQLLSNVSHFAKPDFLSHDLYYFEDNALYGALKRYINWRKSNGA